jgi:hypothetical protein
MTMNELIAFATKQKAVVDAPLSDSALLQTQGALQAMRKMVLSAPVIEIYKSVGGILLGDSELLPINKMARLGYTPKTLIEFNQDLENVSLLGGRTVFARNAFFWLVSDIDGSIAMIEIYTQKTVKKYDDAARAVVDCLTLGVM